MIRLARVLLSLTLGLACAGPALAQDKTILFATWRGCEEACKGVVDYLSQVAPEIAIIHRDAARDSERLIGMVEEARAHDVDLIISWGTTVTLGTAGKLTDLDDPTLNHEIPQVFMIVADPVGSGIIESLERTGRDNLTGVYNRVPENVNIETLRRLLPNMQNLGLLYNPNEENSVIKRDELAELLPQLGVTLIDDAFTLSNGGSPVVEDISDKVRSIKARGAEAIYVGSSSFLRSNAAILGAAARDAGLPVISPYEEMVRDGNALISVAARYYDIGQLAGHQAASILIDGAEAGTLPVAQMKNFALTVNLDFARAVEVWPPIDLLEIADVVK